MRRVFYRTAPILLIFMLLIGMRPFEARAVAGVPRVLSYQGRLTDSAGVLLGGTGTPYYFRFSIWDASSVGVGTKLWPAGNPGTTTLTVTDGVFNASIGDTANGYPDALTYNFEDNDTVYLQIEVSPNGSVFETLGPRQRITSAATAVNAASLRGLVPGTGPTNLLTLGASGEITLASGGVSTLGNVSLGTVSAGTWNGGVIGDAYLTKTGDWTGTFDGQEGSYYLNATNLTNFATPFATAFATKTTDDLGEGSINQYFTNARFDTQLATKTTDDLAEGSVNKYFTIGAFDTAFTGKNISLLTNDAGFITGITGSDVTTALGYTPYDATNPDGYLTSFTELDPLFTASDAASITATNISNWDTAYGWGDHSLVGYLLPTDLTGYATESFVTGQGYLTSLGAQTTDNLSEGTTNLYYTTTRARSAISVSGSPLAYNDTTGVLSIDVADGTTDGYLSSTDWNTFNSKQDALGYTPANIDGSNATGTWSINTSGNAGTVTNGLYSTGSYANPAWITSLGADKITGTLAVANGGTGLTSLTAGYIPFGNATGALGTDADLFWDDTNNRLGIGTATPQYQIDATGDIRWRVSYLLTEVTAGAPAFRNTTSGVAANFRIQSADRDGTDDTSFNIDAVGQPLDANRETLVMGYRSSGTYYRISSFASGTGTLRPIYISATGTETNQLTIATSGNVGIGTTAPATTLHVQATAVAATRESVGRFSVSDAATDFLQVSNLTSANSSFSGSLSGITNTVNTLPSINFSGFVTSGNDASDSSSFGIVDFLASRTSSSADPGNGTLTNIVNRKAFTFRSASTTYMTIMPSGNIGIGTTNPSGLLELSKSGDYAQLFITSAGTGVEPSANLQRARGTVASPTAVLSSDSLGAFGFRGYTGSAYQTSAILKAKASENWSGSAAGAGFAFEVQPNGGMGSRIEAMTIANSGNVGIGTSAPTYNLEVVNDGAASIISATGYRSGTGNAAFIRMQSARGSASSPTTLVSGDIVGTFMAAGYGSSQFNGVGRVRFEVDGTVSGNNVPGRMAFLTSTSGGVETERMRIDSTGNVGIGTTTPTTGKLTIAGGSLADAKNALSITATLPSGTVSTYSRVVDVQAVSSNSTSNAYAFNMDLLAGATDTNLYAAGRFANAVAGTGANLFSISGGLAGNLGTLNIGYGTTIGQNAGALNAAWGGSINVGSINLSTTAKNSATNGGVVGLGLNTGTSPIQFGGYFGLQSTTPTFISAALIADNGGTTSDIFVARDNGTAVFSIKDGGSVGIGNTSPEATLHVEGSAFPVFKAVRTTTETNTFNSGATMITKTSGDMANGFGGGFIFGGQDNAASGNWGIIGAVRDGADGSGALVMYSYASGTASERMRISSAGNVGIGTTTPAYKLQLSSNFAADDGFAMTDTDGGYFRIVQSTGTAGAFQPIFQGYGTGNTSSMIFKGLQTTTGSPTATVTRFISRASDDSSAVNAATNAFTFENGTTTVMAIKGLSVGIGDTSPSTNASRLSIVGGTGTTGIPFQYLSGTLSTTGSGTGAQYLITSPATAGTYSHAGLRVEFLAGYTGTGATRAFYSDNQVAGTGSDLRWNTSYSSPAGNSGGNMWASATTTGTNVGNFAEAKGGNVNVGLFGKAAAVKNSATNIGVIGHGRNTGTSPIQVGGWFSLANTAPTFVSAALVADNGDQTSPIFLARDNSTTVFSIIDGGNVGIGTTSPSALLTLPSTGGLGWEVSSGTVDSYLERLGTGRIVLSANSASDTTSGMYVSSRKGMAANAYFSMYGVNVNANDMFTGARAGTIVLGSLVSNTATADGYDFSFWTGTTAGRSEKMTITKAGNVGIGTTTPETLLHIYKNANDTTSSRLFLQNDSTGASAASRLMVGENNANNKVVSLYYVNSGWSTSNTNIANSGLLSTQVGATGGLVIRTDASAPIIFATGGSANERMRIDSTGNVGIGTTTPTTGKLTIAGGSLADAKNALSITATLPSGTVSTYSRVVDVQAVSSNSTSNAYAFNMDLLAGATDTNLYAAGRFANAVAGTGANLFSISGGLAGNIGTLGIGYGTTIGQNAGALNAAWGGSINVGSINLSTTAKNSATNGGVVGLGLNTGTSPIQFGGYFGLQSTTPTFISAALIADNGGTTSDIFVARDNGSAVFSIKDGGNVGIGTTAPISKLTINSNGGTDYSLPSPGSGTWNIALGISANTALISGMDFKNFNASGQVRLMARGDDDGYIVINAPGSSASANILGQTANTAHYLFNAGTGTGLRNLAIGTIGAKDVIFATNNLERMRISSAGSVGIGDTSPLSSASRLSIAAGSLTSALPAISITATMPTSGSSTAGEVFTFTGAGSNGATYLARQTIFAAGYTGAGSTLAGQFSNYTAATGTGTGGTSGLISYRPVGNQALQARAEATTTGNMIGGTYLAGGGNISIGGWMSATSAKNSATNVGLAAFALNTGTSPIQVGGYFALADYGSSMPTFASAALMADNGSTTSDIFVARDNGSAVFSIKDGGNVGIGTTTPTQRFDVVGIAGDTTVMRVATTSGNACTFSTTTGVFSCASDARLKHDITSIESIDALTKLSQLNPVTYRYNWQSDTEASIAGFVAQEFEQLFPELVTTDSLTGYKSLSYAPLLPYVIKAVQELDIKVQALPVLEDRSLYTTIASFLEGIASRGEAVINKMTTKELCVEDVCVTRDQFLRMIEQSDQTPSASPIPTPDPVLEPEEVLDENTPSDEPVVDEVPEGTDLPEEVPVEESPVPEEEVTL